MDQNLVQKIGWFASIAAMLMYSSYIDQIRLNIDGNPGSIILPIATVINCTAWICYALLKENKDWPIFVCNILGVVVGGITAITAIIY
jgi:uncharacterized protein with PQ loop repeat